MNTSPKHERYDVVIAGGALAGAAAALLLLRERPELRVLVVEKSTSFGRRVGEATVEVSGYFLCRVLGLSQYLNEAHLVKQGMRFWFANDKTQTLADCSEIGGKYLARIPAFQVDRASLDEEILRRAAGAGAEVCRPASAVRVALRPGGDQQTDIRIGDRTITVTSRWVIDASGVAALLARQEGWWRPNDAHPTAAVWARWTNVKDWDGYELAAKYPEWSLACSGLRSTATNHIVGPGWWAWVIPLKGGDVSIGVVFDQRIVKWPEGGSLGQRLKEFLVKHPAAREIMSDAQFREGDVHWRKNLPYHSTTFAGDGFVIIGDAGGFIDPFYSPGMDWVSFTTWRATRLILAERRGGAIAEMVKSHNEDFARSYRRWFEALYLDKYEYMGDYDLMRVAFQLDLGLYYMGVVKQPFTRGPEALDEPVFSTRASAPIFHFMKFYNRRLAKIGRARRKRNAWGRRNSGKCQMLPGFTLSPRSAFPVVKALFSWMRLELVEGWRTWFAPDSVAPSSAPPATEVISRPQPG